MQTPPRAPRPGPADGKTARERAAAAVRISKEGSYVAASGKKVCIRDAVASAVATVEYIPADAPLPDLADTRATAGGVIVPPQHATPPCVTVENTGTVAAALRLAAAGLNPAALNFANAFHPGGGFLEGACAQEEALCWSSALFAALTSARAVPFYEAHLAAADDLASDAALYCPGVPVFVDDAGSGGLLEEPVPLAFITCAAPQACTLPPSRAADIAAAIRSRTRRIVAIAAARGHDAMVLGAWGCGAFRNDATAVARAFAAALEEASGAFKHVVFAVLDGTPGGRVIEPFKTVFSGCQPASVSGGSAVQDGGSAALPPSAAGGAAAGIRQPAF